jgi:sugar phosphate isomerase/epimerase
MQSIQHLHKIVAYIICFLFVSACSAKPIKTTIEQSFFADNGFGEGVAVVQHPAGEYKNGVTYVSYQGPLEDPYVAAYNHDTQQWSGPYKAGTSLLGKDPTKKIDSHGKPTLLIDDAGYIHIFYGGHGGIKDKHGINLLGDYHSGENRHAVSTKPYDISNWQDLNNVSPFGNYNQAIKMDNGDIYLISRHGAHRSDWVYEKSTDNGRTFEAPVAFLKHQRRADELGSDSWYPYVSKGLNNDILVGFDYHYCWDRNAPLNNRGGHSTERKNLYFAKFDTATNTWTNVSGESLAIPITKDLADAKALAVNTGDFWTFNGSTKVDKRGNPHISAFIGKDIGWQIGGPKRASYFVWDGEKWAGNFDNGLPIGRGDFLTPNDSSNNIVRFLLSGINTSTNKTNVNWWNSINSGMTFVKGQELLKFGDGLNDNISPEAISYEGQQQSRPKSLSNLDSPGSAASSFIHNAHPDARIIIAEKPNGSDYRRMYLVGDNGPIMRKNSIKPKLSLQLHSVKNDIVNNFRETLKQVAEMGFSGVEFAGKYGPYKEDPKGLRDYLSSLGLVTSGAHISLAQLQGPVGTENLKFFQQLGVNLIIIPHDARIDEPAQIDELMVELNATSKRVNRYGMQLGYHNHAKEFKAFKSGTFWDYLAINTPPDFVLQLDVGWANYANVNPKAFIQRYPERTLTSHFKIRTYQGKPGSVAPESNVIIGQDSYDWSSLVEVLLQYGGLQWIVIEQEEFPEGLSELQSVNASLDGLLLKVPQLSK